MKGVWGIVSILTVAASLALGALSLSYAQSADSLVVLYTDQGILVIELFEEDAPNHAENFISLASSGFYTDTVFHRIIPGFMIQGGDPNTKFDSGVSPDTWGTGGTGTILAAEFNDIMHNRGIVSMARSSSPDSASSQFFVVHQNSNFLDTQYTVFGRLASTDSYDTLDRIANIPTSDNDRPVEPDMVRIIDTKVMTPDQAISNDILLLEQNPPERLISVSSESVDRNYENEDLNLSMTFPEGWVLQSLGGPGMPDVVAVAPLIGAIPSSIGVYVDIIENVSLDTVIDSKIEDLQAMQDETNLVMVSEARITFNGRDAFVVNAQDTYDASDGPVLVKYQEVTTMVDNRVYSFLFVASSDLFDADLVLFEETISSFDVLTEQEASMPQGGGCLIATAAFGSELAPQVQQLRELRDESLANTGVGRAFLDGFHGIYYSFSPVIADYQRENTVFRDIVRLAITPMISILSVLEHVDMYTEAGALAYGSVAIILISLAYLGAPVIALYLLWQGVCYTKRFGIIKPN